MSYTQEIFDGKTLSDIFSEIYTNTASKRSQINAFVAKLVPLIRTPEDAAVLGPVIKDFIEVNVKSDEHLVRLAQIAQRLEMINAKSKSLESLLSDTEKERLLAEIKYEVEEMQDEADELEDKFSSLSKSV